MNGTGAVLCMRDFSVADAEDSDKLKFLASRNPSMDVFEALRSRLEIRQFSGKPVPPEIKREVLEAARLAPSGMNSQHWRFILVEGRENMVRLADASRTGSWLRGADFAVVVLTDPKYNFHLLDAGRATTHMQLAAWKHGVGSCICTSYDEGKMRQLLNIPEKTSISVVAGFGYPSRPIVGKKRRLRLDEVAFGGTYGKPLALM